ncbi:DUF3006 domain-containing protein [Clostridium sp.]|uniref:DUF3006 domain-containing protein n=1 Tax=Clostridium sp. TaxID=1506 RepID=UPI00260C85F4|nr:DUF3006 domain-containing protein [Clostridium sp.]
MLIVMKDKKFIVDRIENKSVVLEDEKKDIILIDINLFNKQPKDGDVVVMCNNSFYVDEKSTKDKKNKINNLMKGMWEE